MLIVLLVSQIRDGLAVLKSGDATALAALYNSAGGPSWLSQSGWLSGTDGCTWYGVTCDLAGEYVATLTLNANGLEGSIPDAIGSLTHMT